MSSSKIQVEKEFPREFSVVRFVGGNGISLAAAGGSGDTADVEVTISSDLGDLGAVINASEVAVADAAGYFAATDVEAALAELANERSRIWEVTFTETAGAGTYTGQTASPLPDGAVITYVAWRTTAAWDAATTAIDIGITGALTTWASAVDVDGVGADTLIPDPAATGPTVISGSATYFVATITTTGAGGTTGRTKVWVGFTVPDATVAATKA